MKKKQKLQEKTRPPRPPRRIPHRQKIETAPIPGASRKLLPDDQQVELKGKAPLLPRRRRQPNLNVPLPLSNKQEDTKRSPLVKQCPRDIRPPLSEFRSGSFFL